MGNEMDLNIMYSHTQDLIKKIDKNYPLQSHHHMTIEDKDFKGNILDVGSGCGQFGIVAKLKKPEITMTNIDMNPFIATLGKFVSKKSGTNINYYCKALGRDDEQVFKDNEFDCIVLSHVVEHIKDLDKFFKWVNKILKPGGIIYLSFPHVNAHDSPEHYNYFCNEDDMEVESTYNGKQDCINIDKYLKKFNYDSDILLFDEEKADKRHPHKSHGQLDYHIKIKYGGEQ